MSKKLLDFCIYTALLCTAHTANAFEAGNVTVSGELLYLKPALEQSSYVISSNDNKVAGEFFPNGKRHANIPSYKPGFRIDGLYTPCEGSIAYDVRFTYFNGGHSSSTSGPFLFDTVGSPGDGAQSPEDISYNGKAKIHDNFRYYAIDATLNRFNLDSCVDRLTLLIGLQYANIQHRRHFKSSGAFSDHGVNKAVDNSLESRSKLWGVGPLFGLDYDYNLTGPDCCYGEFLLNANFRGVVLCSNNSTDFHYHTLRTAGTAGVNLKNHHNWQVNPGFDARLGGSYKFCLMGIETAIELGYEWIWYNNGINSITGYDVAYAGNSLDLYSNFNIHGPYLRIGASF